MLGLCGLLEHDLGFRVHRLQSLQHVHADLILCIDKLLNGLNILRVRVDGGSDVEAGVVVEVGHVVREVGLRGEEGVVEDPVRLGHHLHQVGVHPLALVRQVAELVHVLLDLLLAQTLLGEQVR